MIKGIIKTLVIFSGVLAFLVGVFALDVAFLSMLPRAIIMGGIWLYAFLIIFPLGAVAAGAGVYILMGGRRD